MVKFSRKQGGITLIALVVLASYLCVTNNIVSVPHGDRNGYTNTYTGMTANENAPPFSFLDPIAGGVLPIRRFTIKGGQIIEKIDGTASATTTTATTAAAAATTLTVETCNVMCLDNDRSDAWEFRGSTRTQNETTTCLLFTNNETNHLGIHQAIDNDPTFVVGFAQKRAHVLRPVSQNGSEKQLSTKKKVLYVLHFHHEVIPHAFEKILNEILPSSWMTSFMDLVVITPLEVSLLVVNGVSKSQENERIISGISTLVNPFCPRDNSRRGSNGQMSLPIARAKFPGYGGYLLVNDDAMVKFWELASDLWFGDRPWGTFPVLKYSQQSWEPRHAHRVYPYGIYGWSWYNYDSGTVTGRSNVVRSNFDAALDAMNELCRNETGIVMDMDNTVQILPSKSFVERDSKMFSRPTSQLVGKQMFFICLEIKLVQSCPEQ